MCQKRLAYPYERWKRMFSDVFCKHKFFGAVSTRLLKPKRKEMHTMFPWLFYKTKETLDLQLSLQATKLPSPPLSSHKAHFGHTFTQDTVSWRPSLEIRIGFARRQSRHLPGAGTVLYFPDTLHTCSPSNYIDHPFTVKINSGPSRAGELCGDAALIVIMCEFDDDGRTSLPSNQPWLILSQSNNGLRSS